MNPILVTGGARGLGAEICTQLALEGHDIIIHYRNSEKEAGRLVEICQKVGVKAEKIAGDFSSPENVDKFIAQFLKRFSRLKGLVNNVGNYLIASLSQTDQSAWFSLFQTNFFAPLVLTQAFLPALIKEQGRIINIGTSGLNGNRGNSYSTAYAASKSALLFYTRSLAKELAPQSVTVNMVSPGFLENSIDLDCAPSFFRKRPGTLKEAAELVAFLFEAASGYITGQNIDIAGGLGL